ncbi:MAG TPA: hypothetical protein VEI50_04140 [Nitrospiraceae bacterium]|nr:hypothetical protein [Nitrospiraceae bacterium]
MIGVYLFHPVAVGIAVASMMPFYKKISQLHVVVVEKVRSLLS